MMGAARFVLDERGREAYTPRPQIRVLNSFTVVAVLSLTDQRRDLCFATLAFAFVVREGGPTLNHRSAAERNRRAYRKNFRRKRWRSREEKVKMIRFAEENRAMQNQQYTITIYNDGHVDQHVFDTSADEPLCSFPSVLHICLSLLASVSE